METIVWPVYINSNHSRKEGRRLSLEESVDEPKIREISQALRRLNILLKTINLSQVLGGKNLDG